MKHSVLAAFVAFASSMSPTQCTADEIDDIASYFVTENTRATLHDVLIDAHVAGIIDFAQERSGYFSDPYSLRALVASHVPPPRDDTIRLVIIRVIESLLCDEHVSQVSEYLEAFISSTEESLPRAQMLGNQPLSATNDVSKPDGCDYVGTRAEAVGSVAAGVIHAFRESVQIDMSEPHIIQLIEEDIAVIRFKNPVQRQTFMRELGITEN